MELRDPKAFGASRTITLTILGKHGSGKTVFLSSMYHHLAEGLGAFSVAATNDHTDRILGGAIEEIVLKKELPIGTTENELKYGFRLNFNGQPIAIIDCFDYRGGAIDDDRESAAGEILSKRIADSDIIMWLIDLSEVSESELALGRSRLVTRLRRLSSICSQAIRDDDRPRVWSFVRSKVDASLESLSSDTLKNATLGLRTHIGGALTISTHKGVPYANLVSIAPIGKVTKDNDKLVAGDDVMNVEWPLLASIQTLLRARIATLDEQIEAAAAPTAENSPRGGFLSSSRKNKPDVVPTQATSEADKEREFLVAVEKHINDTKPESVMTVQPDDVVGRNE